MCFLSFQDFFNLNMLVLLKRWLFAVKHYNICVTRKFFLWKSKNKFFRHENSKKPQKYKNILQKKFHEWFSITNYCSYLFHEDVVINQRKHLSICVLWSLFSFVSEYVLVGSYIYIPVYLCISVLANLYFNVLVYLCVGILVNLFLCTFVFCLFIC